jgi:hypothetical protein
MLSYQLEPPNSSHWKTNKNTLTLLKAEKTMIVHTIHQTVSIPAWYFSLSIKKYLVQSNWRKCRSPFYPNHPVLNYPNKITKQRFWRFQEQGLYYPNEFDKAFTPILSSNDKGESPTNGALLVAPYGKGYYIYTGLSLLENYQKVLGAMYLLCRQFR